VHIQALGYGCLVRGKAFVAGEIFDYLGDVPEAFGRQLCGGDLV